MFENAKLIDIGALTKKPNGALGFKLKLPDNRIITVTGLTVDECRDVAQLISYSVSLRLRLQ